MPPLRRTCEPAPTGLAGVRTSRLPAAKLPANAMLPLTPRLSLALLLVLTFTITACSKKAPEISSLQRKEAASLVSEAEFALALRDRARAEELLTKATALCPDDGAYWLDLGSVRRGLENKDGARQAYTAAAKAYAAAYKADRMDLQSLLQQIYTEALLGNTKTVQKLLKQAVADHPDNPAEKNSPRSGSMPCWPTLHLSLWRCETPAGPPQSNRPTTRSPHGQ